MRTPQRVNRLKAAMQGMQGAQPSAPPLPSAEVVNITPKTSRYPVAPSRVGKRVLSGYFQPEAVKQLHLLSVENDTTIQALLEEALNDLFRKHGKSAIV